MPERKGKALADFRGDKTVGELSKLRAEDEVTEIEPDDGGWTVVRTSRGSEGRAPTNYIQWKGDCYLVTTYDLQSDLL